MANKVGAGGKTRQMRFWIRGSESEVMARNPKRMVIRNNADRQIFQEKHSVEVYRPSKHKESECKTRDLQGKKAPYMRKYPLFCLGADSVKDGGNGY